LLPQAVQLRGEGRSLFAIGKQTAVVKAHVFYFGAQVAQFIFGSAKTVPLFTSRFLGANPRGASGLLTGLEAPVFGGQRDALGLVRPKFGTENGNIGGKGFDIGRPGGAKEICHRGQIG
jgi:hypothetical protein